MLRHLHLLQACALCRSLSDCMPCVECPPSPLVIMRPLKGLRSLFSLRHPCNGDERRWRSERVLAVPSWRRRGDREAVDVTIRPVHARAAACARQPAWMCRPGREDVIRRRLGASPARNDGNTIGVCGRLLATGRSEAVEAGGGGGGGGGDGWSAARRYSRTGAATKDTNRPLLSCVTRLTSSAAFRRRAR